MSNTPSIAAIVPAAGIGSRMKSELPKQYLEINQKTILQHTLEKLLECEWLSMVVVAIHPEDHRFSKLVMTDPRIVTVVGGEQRVDSVRNALTLLQQKGIDWVLVHDAARPLVTKADIEKLKLQVLTAQQGGILACKVKDTIKRGDSVVEETVPRESLWQAYTPQLFDCRLLTESIDAAQAAECNITDEASAMEWAGHAVQLVEGRADNLKITTPEDLLLAQFFLSQQNNKQA